LSIIGSAQRAGVRAATELVGSLRMAVGEAMLFTGFRFA
jgi:hypothetical protein